jgi:hypothetical protein
MVQMEKRYWDFLAAAVLVIAVHAVRAAGADFHSPSAGFTITVPDGWVQIPNDLFLQKIAFFASETDSNPPHWLAAYQQKSDDWFRYPMLLVGKMSYPGDVQPSDARIAEQVNKLLGVDIYQHMKEHHSQLFSKVVLGASVESAEWDGAQHAVHVVTNTNVASWGLVKGYITVFLGKRSMVVVDCSDTDDHFAASLPMFRKVSDSARFDPGFAYDPTLSAGSETYGDLHSSEPLIALGGWTWTALAVAFVGMLIGLIRVKSRSGRNQLPPFQPPAPSTK